MLEVRGIEVDDYAVGDMADAQAVRTALTGCDAALHAAATLYGGKEVYAANVQGARNVLGIGCELGIDPILFISTVVAMFPPAGERFTVDDPIRGLETTYGRSKVEGERFARELQARGAPLVAIYPAGVFGPDDPSLGETTKGLRDGIRFGWPITAGGVSIVDVRDLAEIIAAALEPGRGPRRLMAGGHFASCSELADLCDALTGRRARRLPMPASLLRGIGRLLDAAKMIVPFDYPITHEATKMMTASSPVTAAQPSSNSVSHSARPRRRFVTQFGGYTKRARSARRSRAESQTAAPTRRDQIRPMIAKRRLMAKENNGRPTPP